MILNVSGRTDIVAFYTPWFLNRYKEGFVDVRNPFNHKLVSRINFSDVDCILFCTKNPLPIIPYLKTFKEPIIFHITLTPYKNDIEVNVPDKTKVIECIKEISNIIGIDNVYVRYDPVFLSEKYNLAYHKKAFAKMCELLNGYVKKIIISFIDDYKNVRNNIKDLGIVPFTMDDYKEIGLSFSSSAKKNGMTVQTCFEKYNLCEYGFVKGECLSHDLAIKITGKDYPEWKARRPKLCSCVELIDIGEYNTCSHLCKYCYANYNESEVLEKIKLHNPKSSLLIGESNITDEVKVRKDNSKKIKQNNPISDEQLKLF
jgi:DNA repair photolyase